MKPSNVALAWCRVDYSRWRAESGDGVDDVIGAQTYKAMVFFHAPAWIADLTLNGTRIHESEHDSRKDAMAACLLALDRAVYLREGPR